MNLVLQPWQLQPSQFVVCRIAATLDSQNCLFNWIYKLPHNGSQSAASPQCSFHFAARESSAAFSMATSTWPSSFSGTDSVPSFSMMVVVVPPTVT